jgi:outer membrane protein assembly factor BamD (BamD/ComL family)
MAQDDGAYERAEAKYRQLLETAVDGEDRRWVRLKLAQLAALRGERQVALERYRELWSEGPRDATGGRALWEAAQLVEDDKRRDEMEKQLLREFSETSWSERAAESLVARRCRPARCRLSALRELVASMDDAIAELPSGDNLLFRAARAAHEHGDEGSDHRRLARDWYERIAQRRPDSSMGDDAERQLAEMAIERQDWTTALDYLGRLSNRFDRSKNFGILSSPHTSWAQFQMGWVEMLFLEDYDAAIDAFDRFLKRFSEHPQADDAAWHRAQAYRLAGRPKECRRALKTFLDDYPHSRYISQARTQLEELKQP